MSTTSIRLSDELKDRVTAAADRNGSTAHAYILDAIAEKVEHDELNSKFHELADARYTNIIETGKTIAWEDMRNYLEQRLAGKKPVRPSPKKLQR